MNEVLIGMIVIPVVVGIFKTEIFNFFKAWSIYRARPFDKDRNPNTPDSCQVLCTATGKWISITILKYVMSFDKVKRGVYIRYYNQTEEKLSLIDWANMRKRTKPTRKKYTLKRTKV